MLVKNYSYLYAHKRGLKFIGTEPITAFDFMEQYHKASTYLSMSKKEAFLVFDKFLEGRAKS